jgi:hypothetical protein
MVFWSASEFGRMHGFRTLPWPRETTQFPEHWPKDVGRYWMQAQRSLEGQNWDAASMMARSAIQLVLGHQSTVLPYSIAEQIAGGAPMRPPSPPPLIPYSVYGDGVSTWPTRTFSGSS